MQALEERAKVNMRAGAQSRCAVNRKGWLKLLLLTSILALYGSSRPPAEALAFVEVHDQQITLVYSQGLGEQLLEYIDSPEVFGINSCVEFFGNDWSSLRNGVSRLRFYDVTLPEVAQIPLSEFNLASAMTLGQLYDDAVNDAGVVAFVLADGSGGISPNVVLGDSFFAAIDSNSNIRRPRDLGWQNAILFHELLHYVYQVPDIELANRLGLGAIPDSTFASSLVSDFIRGGHRLSHRQAVERPVSRADS